MLKDADLLKDLIALFVIRLGTFVLHGGIELLGIGKGEADGIELQAALYVPLSDAKNFAYCRHIRFKRFAPRIGSSVSNEGCGQQLMQLVAQSRISELLNHRRTLPYSGRGVPNMGAFRSFSNSETQGYWSAACR